MNEGDFDPQFDFHGFAQRAKEAMAPEKVTAFAARAGLPQATVSKILGAGGVAGPRLDIAAKIADSLGVSLDWLVYGRGDGPDAAAGIVKVPRFDGTLSAGAGSWNEGRNRLDDMPFTAAFLRKRLHRTSTKGLCVLEARGDSMEPTISDGALLLIDEDDIRFDDGVYAFVLDDVARVKRFRKLMDAVTLISDNPVYPPETIVGEDQAKIQMIGHVLWVGQLL
jgi:transcriptional regulator with XRE-family HTH domain